jgi:hypothetical protein
MTIKEQKNSIYFAINYLIELTRDENNEAVKELTEVYEHLNK